jgi:hypothetical protein
MEGIPPISYEQQLILYFSTGECGVKWNQVRTLLRHFSTKSTYNQHAYEMIFIQVLGYGQYSSV